MLELSGITLTPFQRISYTRITVVLGFAAGFLLSHRLWISSRSYPLIPIIHGLHPIPFPLDYVCAGLLFFLLWSIGFASKPRPFIVSFAVLLVFLAIFDQTRWQPWVYLYLFLLLALGCFSWKPGRYSRPGECPEYLPAAYRNDLFLQRPAEDEFSFRRGWCDLNAGSQGRTATDVACVAVDHGCH